jgi:hypothetical protein
MSKRRRTYIYHLAILLGLGYAFSALGGCSHVKNSAVDAVVASSYRPPVIPTTAVPKPALQLLAGDLHCHISPPDFPPHVVRGVEETIKLANQEGLDFVVLTPHVWARFFQTEELRQRTLNGEAFLHQELARFPKGRTKFIVGMEYTDGEYGHISVSFGDLPKVLAGLSLEDSVAHPERFFERYVETGGMLVVNHPFTTPTNFFFSITKEDLSWRPFTGTGPFPAEIQAVSRLVHGFEAFNVTNTELRDRFLKLDRELSIRKTLEQMDREILSNHRPLFAAGGSDSHGHTLRATTFVLSKANTVPAIREAFAKGRVCIRSPQACSLQVRIPNQKEWQILGSSIPNAEAVEVRAQGNRVTLFNNGVSLGRADAGKIVTVPIPHKQCSVIRAKVDGGYSSAIYVNCGF